MIQEQAAFLQAWLSSRFSAAEDQGQHEGQGLVEYALILVLIAVVCVTALTGLAGAIGTALGSVTSAL